MHDWSKIYENAHYKEKLHITRNIRILHRKITLYRRKSLNTDENRRLQKKIRHYARKLQITKKNRTFHAKITYFTQKSHISDENRIFQRNIAHFR